MRPWIVPTLSINRTNPFPAPSPLRVKAKPVEANPIKVTPKESQQEESGAST